MHRWRSILLFTLALGATPLAAPAASVLLSRWTFEAGAPGANEVEGAPAAEVIRAAAAEGRENKKGGALSFRDWSVVDYLRPDPAVATRVVIADQGASEPLTPPPPFRISAWVRPSEAPVYYGGIVEKGIGYTASYRITLLRDLRIAASVGKIRLRSEPIALDAWHEVALSLDAADGGRLVLTVDGREVAAEPFTGGVPSSPEPLVIGERFTGLIDEVTISRP